MDEEIKFDEMMLSSDYIAKTTPLYNSTNQIKDLGCHLKNVSEFVKPFSSAFFWGTPAKQKFCWGKGEPNGISGVLLLSKMERLPLGLTHGRERFGG